MSVRICPRCSTLIESQSAIFCYNCGQELNHAPASNDLVLTPQVDITAKKDTKRKSNIPILTFLTIFLAILLFISLVYLGAFRYKSNAPLLRPSSNEFVSTISALPISPFNFGKQNFASLTPVSIDLYLESSNPKLFLDRFLSTGDKKSLESKVGLNLDEMTSFFDPEFAYVESSGSAALAMVGKDLDFLKDRAAKLSGERLKIQLLDQYFIVSNSSSLLRDMENAYKKVALPLVLMSNFQETVRHLPGTGQVLIYSQSIESARSALSYYFGNRLNLAVSSLSGTSFVINGLSGSTVIRGLNAN